MLKLDLSKNAADFLTAQQAKQAKQIWNKIVELMKDQHPEGSSELFGYPGLFRAKAGQYRIIYRIKSDFLKIVLVDKRDDD